MWNFSFLLCVVEKLRMYGSAIVRTKGDNIHKVPNIPLSQIHDIKVWCEVTQSIHTNVYI